MKILKGKEQVGIIDEAKRTVSLRNRSIDLPANLVLSAGDEIVIRGESYEVLDYNPSWFPDVAKRGAQIIHSKDSSYIIQRTGIGQGSRVLESGVGSGGLTSALLWTIGTSGHLYSVEMDKGAIEKAADNIRSLQDSSSWDVIEGDVKNAKLPDNLDCAILDMPDPWNAIKNVRASLKNGRYLVTYSPTFNQTEKSVLELQKSNFSVIESVEILKRNLLVRPDSTRPDHQMLSHTAFITFAVKKSGHSIEL